MKLLKVTLRLRQRQRKESLLAAIYQGFTPVPEWESGVQEQGHLDWLLSNPEQLRKKLGSEYSPLLPAVQEKLPGFELLEAHICSLPGSPRKYVHFIARGRGTILSVILTRNDGAR